VAANTDFFKGISPQAVLKHGILTRYAIYFAGRAGSRRPVAFVDGYAGEGRYADGNVGSPLLLASSAERAAKFGRDTKLAFVEQDPARHGQLAASLKQEGVEPDQLLAGSFADSIDKLLGRYQGHAVLIFVDPFGLAFDRVSLESILRRSSSGQPIDVLFHFSVSTVARMARAELANAWAGSPPGPNGIKLDAALGDVDWRATFAQADDDDRATHVALEIAEHFGLAVGSATGVRHTSIEVRQRPDLLPKYVLMLFSKLESAHWDFADQAGSAYVDWLHHCDTADYQAAVQKRETSGVLSLFDELDAEPNRESADAAVTDRAVPYLRDHLAGLFKERRALRPIDDVKTVYGEFLGRARAKHVRAALKSLHSEQLIDDDAKGNFWERSIRWMPQVSQEH